MDGMVFMGGIQNEGMVNVVGGEVKEVGDMEKEVEGIIGGLGLDVDEVEVLGVDDKDV